jgi:high-affinity Fe2+/Pb2+ permease
MFGWDPRPSIEQIVAYLGFLVTVSWLFLRPVKAKVDRSPVAAGRSQS